jgi:hypothetical protein
MIVEPNRTHICHQSLLYSVFRVSERYSKSIVNVQVPGNYATLFVLVSCLFWIPRGSPLPIKTQ